MEEFGNEEEEEEEEEEGYPRLVERVHAALSLKMIP